MLTLKQAMEQAEVAQHRTAETEQAYWEQRVRDRRLRLRLQAKLEKSTSQQRSWSPVHAAVEYKDRTRAGIHVQRVAEDSFVAQRGNLRATGHDMESAIGNLLRAHA